MIKWLVNYGEKFNKTYVYTFAFHEIEVARKVYVNL